MGQQVVWVFFICLSVGTTYYILKLLFTHQYTPIFLFPNAVFDRVVKSFILFICFLLFLHSFLADWLDVGFNKTQNDLYRSHKNAFNNTLVWSIVFFAPYLYNHKAIQNTGFEVALIDLFLLSRTVFSLGYILGAIIGHQSIRLMGFTISITCCIIMVGEVFGMSIIKYLK